jgi:hypothetical protein
MATKNLIKPLEKKSICWSIELFRDNTDGSTSWVNIEDHYRWGQGFVEAEVLDLIKEWNTIPLDQ